MSKIINSVSKYNQGCITIRVTTSQSIPNSTATAISAFDTILVNQGGGIITVNSAVFTVTVGGLYLLSGDVSFDNNATGNRSIYFRASNSPTFHRGQILTPAVNGNHTLLSTSAIVYLAAAETITVYVEQTSGGALNLIPTGDWAAAEISIYKL